MAADCISSVVHNHTFGPSTNLQRAPVQGGDVKVSGDIQEKEQISNNQVGKLKSTTHKSNVAVNSRLVMQLCTGQ